MFNSYLFILIVLFTTGSFLPTANFRRIIGGRPAELGEFPIVAKISRPDGSRFCGGVIVTERAILTAAHCYACKSAVHCPRERVVMVGDILLNNNRKPPRSRQVFKTNGVIIHKSYRRPDYKHDIAIVPLSRRIIFSKNVRPARLPTLLSNYEIGTKCAVVGWGKISKESDADSSNELLATAINIQNPNDCERSLKGYFAADWMICAGDLTGVNDSCRGDSGGPLLCKGDVVGLVSIGYCALSGGYTSVLMHLDWVKQKIQDYKLDNKGNQLFNDYFNALLFGEVLFLIITNWFGH